MKNAHLTGFPAQKSFKSLKRACEKSLSPVGSGAGVFKVVQARLYPTYASDLA